mgnify:CR=1 FL=1
MGTVYSQLSITEQRRIERWRHAKVPFDEMARVLNAAAQRYSENLSAIISQMKACQNIMDTTVVLPSYDGRSTCARSQTDQTPCTQQVPA